MKKALVLVISLLTITSSADALRVRPQTDDIPDTGNALYCPQLSQTLKRGMRDASTYPAGQVSELQNFLADYFELNEQDVISGFFGRNTQRYVMNFQQKYGLPAYGIAGTLTRMKIAEICTSQTVQPPVCNNYPKPTCGPNQKLFEEWNDYRGCPTVGRCVDVVNLGQPNVSISTPRTSYITGEPVLVTTKATRTLGNDYGAATPAEGYKVLVTVTYPEGAFITNFNPTYNASTGYWEGSYVPSYNGGAHVIRTELYCTNKSLPCGSYIGITTDQVITSAKTTISVTQASSVPTCTISTDKSSYQLNDTITFSWTSTGASYAQFLSDTSGKDALQVPGDKLPAQGSQQIRATVYGNPYVTLKVVGPEGQSALCQKTVSVTYTNSGPLTVQASLADPKGLGRESFPFGEQLVIKWNVSDPSDVETAGWGIYGKSETSIELHPVDNPTAASTRVIRVAETGVFPHTFTWNVTQEGLFGDRVAPGRYYIYVNVPSKKQRGYVVGVAGPIGIGGTTASNGITVTAPNGGEQWQLGSTNSITWSPYSYNPDVNPSRDVKAYLEQKDAYGNFVTVGRITDSGKASIHWNGYLEDDVAQGYVNHRMARPGSGYFIRVVNKVTGASDRSDSPFSIMPQGSIKVSVEMLSYPPGSRVVYDPQFHEDARNVVEITDQKLLNSFGNYTVSWRSTVAVGTCSLIYPGRTMAATGNTLDKIDNLPTSGTQAISLFHDGRQPFFSVSVHCDHAATGSVQGSSIGYVYIKPMFTALSITEPNGGVVNADQESTIKWTSAGIAQNSIALYKNDQWYKWILRDYPGGNSGTSWTPRNYITDADIASGSIWKIYITGQRSDGTGYLDDKSDTPFSFSSSTIPDSISLTQPAASTFYTLGQPIPIAWNIPVPNARQKTQVLVELKGVNTTGGNGGGIWQSAEIQTTPGQTNGSYAWQTGGYGGLNATGAYAVTVYWVDCEPQGCTYNYDQQGGLGRRRYAQSNPVYITINPAVSQGSAGSSAGGVSGSTVNPYDLLWSFSPVRIFGN